MTASWQQPPALQQPPLHTWVSPPQHAASLSQSVPAPQHPALSPHWRTLKCPWASPQVPSNLVNVGHTQLVLDDPEAPVTAAGRGNQHHSPGVAHLRPPAHRCHFLIILCLFPQRQQNTMQTVGVLGWNWALLPFTECDLGQMALSEPQFFSTTKWGCHPALSSCIKTGRRCCHPLMDTLLCVCHSAPTCLLLSPLSFPCLSSTPFASVFLLSSLFPKSPSLFHLPEKLLLILQDPN